MYALLCFIAAGHTWVFFETTKECRKEFFQQGRRQMNLLVMGNKNRK